MAELTEAEIIRHVQTTGRYVSQMKDTPYHAHWKGKSLWAAGTRELVLQICQIEGIKSANIGAGDIMPEITESIQQRIVTHKIEITAIKHAERVAYARRISADLLPRFLRELDAPYNPIRGYGTRRFSFITQCRDKKKYPTWKDANHDAQMLYHRTNMFFVIYKCGYCNSWHVGRKLPKHDDTTITTNSKDQAQIDSENWKMNMGYALYLDYMGCR